MSRILTRKSNAQATITPTCSEGYVKCPCNAQETITPICPEPYDKCSTEAYALPRKPYHQSVQQEGYVKNSTRWTCAAQETTLPKRSTRWLRQENDKKDMHSPGNYSTNAFNPKAMSSVQPEGHASIPHEGAP
jgi:hypothetical protein